MSAIRSLRTSVNMKSSLLLLLVLFLGGCLIGQADENCKGKCVCQTTVNGTELTIDLHNYFNYPINGTRDYSSDDNKKFRYSFSPCQPMSCYPGQPDAAAACQYNTIEGKEYQAVSLGNISDLQWDTVKDEYDFVIKITGGAPTPGSSPQQRQAMIIFQHNKSTSSNNLRYLMETTADNVITYHFVADIVTVGGGVPDGIVGIVLIVIFIVVVATYFIVGGLIMYFMRGARGVEVIPNYTFWKDVPSLIKDGFLFTISPCRNKFSEKGYQAL